jgi:hypothetical protein
MFIYSSTTRTIENAKERVGECRGVITESIRMVNLGGLMLDVGCCALSVYHSTGAAWNRIPPNLFR